MRFRAVAPMVRCAIIPLFLLIVVASFAGCGPSSTSAPKVGGAKVDEDVEAQNRKAIETYNTEKK
jgi:hypothetical protein